MKKLRLSLYHSLDSWYTYITRVRLGIVVVVVEVVVGVGLNFSTGDDLSVLVATLLLALLRLRKAILSLSLLAPVKRCGSVTDTLSNIGKNEAEGGIRGNDDDESRYTVGDTNTTETRSAARRILDVARPRFPSPPPDRWARNDAGDSSMLLSVYIQFCWDRKV